MNSESTQQIRKRANDGACLVVGANRGIGLALTRNLLEGGAGQVWATCRAEGDTQALAELKEIHSGNLQILSLDVTDGASLDSFAKALKEESMAIELVIHSAGILHEQDIQPERSLQQCEPARLLRMFEVNSIGPLMLARALLPLQNRQQPFVFAALSAMVGSIGENHLGGWYGYRASKAALNQFIRTLSNECRIRYPQAAIVAIHPGTTDTDLSRPFQRNISPEKLYTAEQSASRILSVLNKLDASKSGRFYNWDGSEIAW